MRRDFESTFHLVSAILFLCFGVGPEEPDAWGCRNPSAAGPVFNLSNGTGAPFGTEGKGKVRPVAFVRRKKAESLLAFGPPML